MNYFKLAIIVMLVISSINLEAQQYYTINGKVQDDETKKTLSYATISIKEKPIGAVTNDNGEFIFHIPVEYKNDSIFISCLGYKTYKNIVSKCNQNIEISLEPIAYLLRFPTC